MITNDGTMIRTPADGIPMYGRSASGVIVMRLAEGSSLVNFALTEKETEEASAAEASEDESAAEPVLLEEDDDGVILAKMDDEEAEDGSEA